jgi:hypothetical protein
MKMSDFWAIFYLYGCLHMPSPFCQSVGTSAGRLGAVLRRSYRAGKEMDHLRVEKQKLQLENAKRDE